MEENDSEDSGDHTCDEHDIDATKHGAGADAGADYG